MGRKRRFDRDTVLFAAANAFRRRGYREVSIADLEVATGLAAGSIYHAFGGKPGLFRAALDLYVHGFVAERLARFAGEGARLEDLEQLYLSVLAPPLDDGFGCLVANTIVEFGRDAGLGAVRLDATLAMVRAAIGRVLAAELGAAAPAGAAEQLFVLYHGLLVLLRSRTDPNDLALAVRAAFAPLKDLRSRHRETPTER